MLHKTFHFSYGPRTIKNRVKIPTREEIFLLQNHTEWLWGSTRYPFDGYPEVKQPECEVDNSPPTSAEVKDECSYTSTTIKCLHGVDRTTLLIF